MQRCGKGKSILLVEDEAVIAMTETEQLSAYGYSIVHVLTGEEAVEAAADSNSSFDIILMDIDLGGGIDGTESASKILERRDIPVIFMYSYIEPEIVEKTEKVTSYGYVAKNSGITVLDASIKMAVKLHNKKLELQERNKELSIKEAELMGIQQTAHIWGAAQDITERKLADRAIRESEGKLKAITENITSTILLSDRSGNITYTNKLPPEMTREQIVSSTVYDYVPVETHPVISNALRDVFEEGTISTYETLGPGSSGGTGIFRVTVSPVLAEDKVVSAVFLADDITELKEDQQKIRQQLEEKEVILREAHHRIKNNIFSIESLLRLQAESADGKESKTILRDAIGRVEGMRRLYEKMLLSESYHEISIKDYFEDLLAAVTGLFGERTGITIERSFDNAVVDVKILFLLGIIVNELITNSMKYAFPDSDSGIIRLNLSIMENKGILTVSDNGIGLPADFDPDKSGGFGLKLIKMLTKQLNGSLQMENSCGTKCIVSFRLQ